MNYGLYSSSATNEVVTGGELCAGPSVSAPFFCKPKTVPKIYLKKRNKVINAYLEKNTDWLFFFFFVKGPIVSSLALKTIRLCLAAVVQRGPVGNTALSI